MRTEREFEQLCNGIKESVAQAYRAAGAGHLDETSHLRTQLRQAIDRLGVAAVLLDRCSWALQDPCPPDADRQALRMEISTTLEEIASC
jgi:hypothetical protein